MQIYSHVQQKLARIFAALTETTNFLSRTSWPFIDIVFRIWLAKELLVAGILMAHNWDSSILLVQNEYPIRWLNPQVEAFLGILAQIGGGLSLLFGLLTRLGALAIIILALVTQVYYVKLDINLFWIALMAGYLLRGPGPISLDYLLKDGIARSPILFASALAKFFDATRSVFSDIYLLGLRLWLSITLLIVSYRIIVPPETMQSLFPCLPVHSAMTIFVYSSFLLSLLFMFGFATRIVALISFVLICLAYPHLSLVVSPFYWMMTMAIFVIFGAGKFSLDELIFKILKRYFPQLSGKPAFTLENLLHVVIIGAGFGGVTCAKALRHVPVRITLIDQHNYHLFQPLLYQVATGGLAPGDIAIPIRSIFADQFNAEVLLAKVNAIDKDKQLVISGSLQIPYDYLVIATGAKHSYFGKDIWEPYAPGLKQIEDATSVRSKIIETFERAELETDDEEREKLLNLIIVGGGPTGVELAGAIAELSQYGIKKDFRHFDPASAKIILIQAAPRILPTFSETISTKAKLSLEKMNVKILLNSRVEQIDAEGVVVNGERIYSKSVLWAAGVSASPAAQWLGVEADRSGRVKVTEDLSIANYSNIFVIGDTALANAWDGKPVPGLAPAAKQQGKFVASLITKKTYNQQVPKIFKYKHLGSLATIGRKSAVVEINRLKISGASAWWFWGFVHIFFLVGGRNRFSVIFNWIWSYFTFRSNNLLITDSEK